MPPGGNRKLESQPRVLVPAPRALAQLGSLQSCVKPGRTLCSETSSCAAPGRTACGPAGR